MAHRYWKLKGNSGYAGTDFEEEIDLVKHWGVTAEEIEEMDEMDVKNKLDDEAWVMVIEKCEGYAEPLEGIKN